ncbi:hypothetical protein JCM11491_005027 [Sporobolomyces phaffii]
MAPKPKGLKASKRAAPFDPTTTTPAAAPAAEPASASERTYPLDEDCLTLTDLFELRLTVLDLLYPFPTDLAISQPDPHKRDEARSFLRGILHGCAVLEQYVDLPGSDADEVDQRRADAGEDKLAALGLHAGPITKGLVLYLQAWSLHHLGELFDDAPAGVGSSDPASSSSSIPHAAVSRLASGGGGGGPSAAKKRKVDLDEPRSRIEWLEAGLAKYRVAHDDVSQDYACNGDEDHVVMALTNADFVRCQQRIARVYFDQGDVDRARDVASECGRHGLSDRAFDDAWGIGCPEPECVEVGDAVLAQLRAWSDAVAFVESYPLAADGESLKLVAASRDGDAEMWQLAGVEGALMWDDLDDGLAQMEDRSEGRLREQVKLWRWLKDVVDADAKMVAFIKMEDALEAKYRPDDDDDEEEEEDEGEGEVKELPMDADDVKFVTKASEAAISALRATITAFASLPSSVAHPAGKDSQYRKLEEVLLISSALVNPSDTEGTAKIEQEIEQVRKDGGLDDDDGEDAGPDKESSSTTA